MTTPKKPIRWQSLPLPWCPELTRQHRLSEAHEYAKQLKLKREQRKDDH